MKYVVNEACVGCGACAGVCPEVFSMTDAGVAVSIKGDVPAGAEASAEEAMNGCPVAAIERQ
ncbi:MAG: ferredoxin [Pyramidobacter sp.]|nr:ferredoxin [Pyramidobacter sp.]